MRSFLSGKPDCTVSFSKAHSSSRSDASLMSSHDIDPWLGGRWAAANACEHCSSTQASLLCVADLHGYLDIMSAVLFDTPGMWMILKSNWRVFSFMRSSLGFSMVSSDLSLNIFVSGLWSTATMRSGDPSMNNLHCLSV